MLEMCVKTKDRPLLAFVCLPGRVCKVMIWTLVPTMLKNFLGGPCLKGATCTNTRCSYLCSLLFFR